MPYKDPEKYRAYQAKYHADHKSEKQNYDKARRNGPLREQILENKRQSAKDNPEGDRRRGKRHRDKVRDSIIDAYGAKCACCGIEERVFLAIDHVNNDGAKERKLKNKKRIYLDIVEAGFPPNYQLLCHNCNWAKFALGKCPHQP